MADIKGIDPDLPVPKIVLDEHLDLSRVNEQLDEIYADMPDMETKRIMLMRQLHAVGHKAAYLLARLLHTQNEILRERYDAWKAQRQLGNVDPGEEYTQPRSVYQWAEIVSLGIGERQIRRYLIMYEESDPKISTKLGTAKHEIIQKAPAPIREEIAQRAMDEGWNVKKVSAEVDRVREKARAERAKESIQLPALSITILDRTKVVLEVPVRYREALADILNIEAERLREKIYWRVTKE